MDEPNGVPAFLHNNVDGIITNHPDWINNILREPDFENLFRLANTKDNPWFIVQ
ncbi:sphingomyelinase D-like protein [Leptotrombidium deliense]|uniref:Sphingomyelinase D-like protein n=1 Tax=Leptotrombidium deliense TaxID=299467 RepID=A0A443RXG4_9ACAR|nr:sphingomyelinase D-like protein [Leptotrombidium deliense]